MLPLSVCSRGHVAPTYACMGWLSSRAVTATYAVLWSWVFSWSWVCSLTPDNASWWYLFWGGGLLQVDTFTAGRYSPHLINWVDQGRAPGMETCNSSRQTGRQNQPQTIHTPSWQLPHTHGIESCNGNSSSHWQYPHTVHAHTRSVFQASRDAIS